MPNTLRTELADGVFSIVLTRAAEYNTITVGLRDELSAAIDEGDANDDARVILLRAEGQAFCAGYGLDWSTELQAQESSGGRVWDSAADLRGISTFVDVYMKLFKAWKPTIAAVKGWCIAGGTDMVLCADIIVAGESASFGYPPSRVWGTPTTAMWVYRLGLERAKRYLLTGDEIKAPEAARMGLILEAVPDDQLQDHAMALAKRMALLPTNQLVMLKLLCNQTVENMGLASSAPSGRCSTASPVTLRKASISSLDRARSASARPCGSGTTPSGTTALVRSLSRGRLGGPAWRSLGPPLDESHRRTDACPSPTAWRSSRAACTTTRSGPSRARRRSRSRARR